MPREELICSICYNVSPKRPRRQGLQVGHLIIQGEDDPMVLNLNAHIFACLTPGSQLEFVACGHMLMLVFGAGTYINGECITVDGGLAATRLSICAATQ